MSINVAVTGGFCSGKSSVCRELEKYGFTVFESDAYVHKVLKKEKVISVLCEAFGQDIVNGSEIDRGRLAGLAFKDKESWKKINRIIHPLVIREVKKEIEQASSGELKAFEIPLLFEAGMEGLFDRIVFVDASMELRRQRALKRGFQEEDIEKRSRYLTAEEKKKTLSDHIVENSGNAEDLHRQIEQVITQIKTKGEGVCQE